MLIVVADSEEGVLGMLERVPCWDASATEVVRLHALEELPGEPSGEHPAGSGVASLDRAREERGRADREAPCRSNGAESPS